MRTTLFLWLMTAALVGCRNNKQEVLGFDAPTVAIPSGGALEVALAGSWAMHDSAGVRIERAASPYRVAVYIKDRPPPVPRATELVLHAETSGRSVRVPLGPPVQIDGTTYFEASNVDLPYEDFRMVVRLEHEREGVVVADSVSVPIERRYTEEFVSLWDWLTRL